MLIKKFNKLKVINKNFILYSKLFKLKMPILIIYFINFFNWFDFYNNIAKYFDIEIIYKNSRLIFFSSSLSYNKYAFKNLVFYTTKNLVNFFLFYNELLVNDFLIITDSIKNLFVKYYFNFLTIDFFNRFLNFLNTKFFLIQYYLNFLYIYYIIFFNFMSICLYKIL